MTGTCASCPSPAMTVVYLTFAAGELDRVGLPDRRMIACFTCKECSVELTRDPEAGRRRVVGRMSDRRTP